MKNSYPPFKNYIFLLFLFVFLSSLKTHSQNTLNQKDTVPFLRFGSISTKFTKPTFELKKGSIVSNVLKLINHDNRTLNFKVDALFPGGWTRIDDATKLYTVRPKDTAIVPIIISPTKLVNGNTEIIVNAFIIDQTGRQIGNNYFTLTTKKKVAWKLNLKNNTNYYFKNNEVEKDFTFSVSNNGNYDQDIFLSYLIPRKDLILADTLSNPIKDASKTFTLKAGEEREFTNRVIATNFEEKNRIRVPINNYNPSKNKERTTRTLLVNSSEPKINKTDLQKRTKVNFIKLPNETQSSPFGYPNLPLILDLNAQNVLDDRSFLSLNLQGFKQLNEKASLSYFTQFNYSNSFFTNNVFQNAPWYVGYFDDKMSIEIGQVSGDVLGIAAVGKGVKGSYRFNDQHSAGVFYTNSNGFFNANQGIMTFGGWHRFKYNENIRVKSRIARSNNRFQNRNTTILTLEPSVRLLNAHTVSLITGVSLQEFIENNSSVNKNGFLVGANYSSFMLDKKLRSNLSFRFNDRNFSNGIIDRVFINNRFTYELSKEWLAILTGNYQNSRFFNRSNDQLLYRQQTLFTNLIFSKRTNQGSYQPGIFYESRNFPNNSFVLRGLNFRYSIFNLEQNLLSSVFTRAGYARPLDAVDPKEYFSLEINGLFRYRTWNLTAWYNLGTFSAVTSLQNQNSNLTPQAIRLSLQNQHQFSDRHFVVESSMIYSYNNVFKTHSLGLFPQLFYFSDSGWRFGASLNYIFSSRDFSSVFDPTQILNQNQQLIQRSVNNDINLNFNLRKEFGIPIPFADKIAANSKFVSFFDINGNGIKDKDETPIDNVVIKLGRNEVITNFEGEATIKNVGFKKYKFEILSLEDQKGWFANVQDSLVVINDGINYIPFVRGIKVYGDVIVDRQQIAVTDDKPLDLSRIKISALKDDKIYNTLTNNSGRFEFYLPFGNYTITMDENILGDRFRVSRNNIPITLRNNQDGVYISFYIVEKRRKVIFKDFTKKKN